MMFFTKFGTKRPAKTTGGTRSFRSTGLQAVTSTGFQSNSSTGRSRFSVTLPRPLQPDATTELKGQAAIRYVELGEKVDTDKSSLDPEYDYGADDFWPQQWPDDRDYDVDAMRQLVEATAENDDRDYDEDTFVGPGVQRVRNRQTYREAMIKKEEAWERIRRQLFVSFIVYERASKNFQINVDLGTCPDPNSCQIYTRTVTFITFERQWKEEEQFCSCTKDSVRLLLKGFLAVSPSVPETAVSLVLLQYLKVNWEQVPTGIHGWSNGLWKFHEGRGGVLRADGSHRPRTGGPLIRESLHVFRDLLLQKAQYLDEVSKVTTAQKLARQCPCCYGPRQDTDLPKRFVDSIIALDGNFGHSRPTTAAQNDFRKFLPTSFLKTMLVDDARVRVAAAGGDTVKVDFDDTACSDGWRAMDGGAAPPAFSGQDDTGLFGMVCRHEIAIKLINLVKSGEKLHNPLALVDWILTVDPSSKLGVLYDIACNFEAHLKKRELLSQERLDGRLQFGVSVFHAFAHNWLCQMNYNPRMIEGFGLSDGEWVERFWSKIACLIRLNRTASSSLRLTNIHFLTERINQDGLFNLVTWLQRHYRNADKRMEEARLGLEQAEAAGWNVDELRTQWRLQREIQSKTGEQEEAAKRRKAFENVGGWLSEVDSINSALAAFRRALEAQDAAQINTSVEILLKAEKREADLKAKIDRGLAELAEGRDLAEIRHVCLLQDALHRLREQVVKYKMTLEPIVQTRRGRLQQLGHNTVQKILRKLGSPRKKLEAAVRSYDAVVQTYVDQCSPTPPPLKAVDAKTVVSLDDSDPFWNNTIFGVGEAKWFTDLDCRKGIQALLLGDRCEEELQRLDAEVARLIRWSNQQRLQLLGALAEWRPIESSGGDTNSDEVAEAKSPSTRDEGSCHGSDNSDTSEVDLCSRGTQRTAVISRYLGMAALSSSTVNRESMRAATVHLLETALWDHYHLENTWFGDGIETLWTQRASRRISDSELDKILFEVKRRFALSYEDAAVTIPRKRQGDHDATGIDLDAADDRKEDEFCDVVFTEEQADEAAAAQQIALAFASLGLASQ